MPRKYRPFHETARGELHVLRERAVLAGLLRRGDARGYEEPLSEMRSLVGTAGADIVGEVIQKKDRPNPARFFGRGKVEEIADLVKEMRADVVIVDNDLSPAQVRSLEEALKVKVIDRSELILDIFATHAKTRQAKLQVELAQLEYSQPRLKKMWTHLSRLAGAGGGGDPGIGLRGPGETQLETDRRIVNKRIADLKKKISKISERKKREVQTREKDFTIALVGYTNAGKSTLFNSLTGADVKVDDKLFATLDTRTRLWDIGRNYRVLLSDTVGFIRNLPHHLVASFNATLEEVSQANLLLHVVDGSRTDPSRLIEAVKSVLGEIGCAGKPNVLLANKIDLLPDPVELRYLQENYGDCIPISAKSGEGIDRLAGTITGHIDQRYQELVLAIHAGLGKLISFVEERANILERSYEGDSVVLKVLIETRHAERLRRNPDVEVIIP
ncbi:MAG: GTPase HflX [Planctomycetota bacterium]|nr:MAG: GTPase HflX [Planctomycetota bacterium]